MWTIEDALMWIRRMQPELSSVGYHVALGGGVLNKGFSMKDLDLYLLPFEMRHDMSASDQQALSVMERLTGVKGIPFNSGDTEYPEDQTFKARVKMYLDSNRRIDVFIA